MLSALLGALLIGMLMGTCGAGGGILTVPLLITVLGLSMQEAAPVALATICVSTAIGAIDGLRLGLARYRAAILIALASLPFTALALRWAAVLSQTALMLGFAMICLISACHMLYAPMHDEGTPTLPNVGVIDHKTGRFRWSVATAMVMSAVGAASGMMTGLFGVGGGFVIVPMLRQLTHLSQRGTVATSLLVMVLVSGGGMVVALAHGIQFPLSLTVSFAGVSAFGLVLGRVFAKRLPLQHIQRLFALLVLLMACGMLIGAMSHR